MIDRIQSPSCQQPYILQSVLLKVDVHVSCCVIFSEFFEPSLSDVSAAQWTVTIVRPAPEGRSPEPHGGGGRSHGGQPSQ